MCTQTLALFLFFVFLSSVSWGGGGGGGGGESEGLSLYEHILPLSIPNCPACPQGRGKTVRVNWRGSPVIHGVGIWDRSGEEAGRGSGGVSLGWGQIGPNIAPRQFGWGQIGPNIAPHRRGVGGKIVGVRTGGIGVNRVVLGGVVRVG